MSDCIHRRNQVRTGDKTSHYIQGRSCRRNHDDRQVCCPLILISGAVACRRRPRRKRGTSSPTSPARSPRDSRNEVGQWEVAKDGDNHVLYQKAKNDDATFNVALVEGTSYKDLDLSVKLRAVAGEVDRGGGLVWRAKDKKNYYICRYNPLEDNFRVYKVVDGKRTMFTSAKMPGDEKWHTLRVTMAGPRSPATSTARSCSRPRTRHFPRRA